jgi:hypothetical protein
MAMPFAMILLSLGLLGRPAFAETITTNEIVMTDAPSWVTESRIDRVVSKIQSFMEWDIRKIQVRYYSDQTAFEQAHGLGPIPIAVSKRADNTVHLGPKVTKDTFDTTFGHELVHIVLFQKYKDAIPSWLDEGLANFVAQHGKVDYKWLSKQPPGDVKLLTHPFGGSAGNSSAEVARFHYQTAQALMEMISSKCDVHQLLQLSVGKKLEGYLDTYCGIPDLNIALQSWVKRKSR